MAEPDAPAAITNADLANLHSYIHGLQEQITELKSQPVKGFEPAKPEFYDGKSISKLRDFLTQVRLVFAVQPSKFSNDRDKVLYAASLLRGAAFTWIQPYLDAHDPPDWMNDFARFATEITAAFGDPNYDRNNLFRLKRLRQTGSVASYTAEFRRLTPRSTLSETALVQQYFEGLKEPLQDTLTVANYPEELEPLIQMATRLDNLQYQRRMQRGQEARYSAPAQRKRQLHHAAAKPQPVHPARPANPTHDTASTSIGPFGSRPMEIGAARPRFRHLTEEEREYRRQNDLCMYCGKPGHIAQECSERSKKPYGPARVSGANFTATDSPGNVPAQQQ
jgi:hypothetical protein